MSSITTRRPAPLRKRQIAKHSRLRILAEIYHYFQDPCRVPKRFPPPSSLVLRPYTWQTSFSWPTPINLLAKLWHLPRSSGWLTTLAQATRNTRQLRFQPVYPNHSTYQTECPLVQLLHSPAESPLVIVPHPSPAPRIKST